MKRLLITGGAGFVGSSLALSFKRDQADLAVLALDNLKRQGSELNLPRLKKGGVKFVHGDIRNAGDLAAIGPVDLLIECSAEPSVQAGYGESPRYLIDTNLGGAVNCLEHLRNTGGRLIFLSSSRIYPIAPLRGLPLERRGDRLHIEQGKSGPGWSAHGIGEDFPLDGPRSLYGTTKFCAELLIDEYREMYGLDAVVDRCGVIAGPWQMGRVDQGFVALWVAAHLYGSPLQYIGFDGKGHQVRDILHIDDLYALLRRQLQDDVLGAAGPFNVGGGVQGSVSLRELTEICRQATGKALDIGERPDTHPADIPYYVTDTSKVETATGWAPTKRPGDVVADIHRWIADNRAMLEPVLKR